MYFQTKTINASVTNKRGWQVCVNAVFSFLFSDKGNQMGNQQQVTGKNNNEAQKVNNSEKI